MAYRYVPIVRTKAGEVQALAELTPAAKAKIFPVIVMTAEVPPTFQPSMVSKLPEFPIALDGTYNYSQSGSPTTFNALFSGLGTGIPVIPAISFDPDPGYLAAVKSKVGKFAPGLVVQVPIGDLPHAEPWVAAQGWPPSIVDLIVMVGEVAGHDPATMAGYVSHALTTGIKTTTKWRSVALNSWSAPKDHGSLARGRNLVPRKEWKIWKLVYPAVSFQLDYSDMGHVHPSLDEVPGYAMANATVSVRYAVDGEWIIIKGRPISGANGKPMSEQYRGHARALMTEPKFGGIGCWADTRIAQYAGPTGGSGGRPQWAAVSLNRHMSLVANSLP